MIVIVDAEIVTVDAEGQIVGAVLELVEVVVEVEVIVEAEVWLVAVPTKQEHALESLEAEEEHGDAKAGIDRAGATVYVWQKDDALLGWLTSALRQLSALQTLDVTVLSKILLRRVK